LPVVSPATACSPVRILTFLARAIVALSLAVPTALAGKRIYWSNYNGDTISFANLDGNGGSGDLNTVGSTTQGSPEGPCREKPHCQQTRQ